MDDGDKGGARADTQRVDWIPFCCLLLAVIAFGALEWHPFLLPNNDYYSFEKAARPFRRIVQATGVGK